MCPDAGASRAPLASALLVSLALHGALLAALGLGASQRSPERVAPVLWVRVLPAAASPALGTAREAPRVGSTPTRDDPRAAPAAAKPAPVAAEPLPHEPDPAPVAEAPAAVASAPPAAIASAPPAAIASAPPAVVASAPPASRAELRPLRQPRPRYPRAARARGAEGVTWLRVRVEGSGRVGDVRVERSAGDAELDRAARRAIRSWRFAPLAAELWVLIPVEFRLN